MKFFDLTSVISDTASDCTDFHLSFLENLEQDLEKNPVPESPVKIQKKGKSLNITKYYKVKKSKLYMFHKIVINRGIQAYQMKCSAQEPKPAKICA